VDNASLAERLEAFAALLDLSGSSYYTVRAYRRAAELIRSTPADVAALVRSGRVRELAGIGAGIEARLHELETTGELAELRELEAEAMPELVGVGRLLGLSPKRMRELGKALGVRTVAGLREAVDAGRLSEVRGVGPKTAERIRAGLAEAARARPRRGMLLHRADALVGEVAAALGGVVEADVVADLLPHLPAQAWGVPLTDQEPTPVMKPLFALEPTPSVARPVGDPSLMPQLSHALAPRRVRPAVVAAVVGLLGLALGRRLR